MIGQPGCNFKEVLVRPMGNLQWLIRTILYQVGGRDQKNSSTVFPMKSEQLEGPSSMVWGCDLVSGAPRKRYGDNWLLFRPPHPALCFPLIALLLPSQNSISNPSGQFACQSSFDANFHSFGNHHGIADGQCRFYPQSIEIDENHTSIKLAPRLCLSQGWKSISCCPVPNYIEPCFQENITGCRAQTTFRCIDEWLPK